MPRTWDLPVIKDRLRAGNLTSALALEMANELVEHVDYWMNAERTATGFLVKKLKEQHERNEKLQSEIDGLDGHYSSELIERDEEIAWLMNELFDLKNPPIVIRNSTKMKKIQENTGAALYELDLLHKKVNPRRNGNIDNHFKHIKNWLKDE